MTSYRRETIELITTGSSSAEIQLVTNMKTGKSHLELRYEQIIRTKTNNLDKIKEAAKNLISGRIDFDMIKAQYDEN